MTTQPHCIYHLVPARIYQAQPVDQPYRPLAFADEGFIHCAAGAEQLVMVANRYFGELAGRLLVLEIELQRLAAPVKFEPPIPPKGSLPAGIIRPAANCDSLFPHIYGPLNREAISNIFALQRNPAGQWQLPD